MTPFRVVLANGQILFLQSIRKNLEEVPGLEIIGEVCGAPELWKILKKCPTDMVVLDADNLQQIEMIKEIKRLYPTIKILVLMVEKSKFLLQAILARADGYLLKENAYSELINAIDKIRQGGTYFCNIISGKMADIIRTEMSDKIKKTLTTKQIKILTLRCESKSCREIAELLSLSPSTVRNYMTNIKRKLNIKAQSDLLTYAIRQGFIV
jgi:two-component system, NarL family, response regulator NreC